MTQQNEQIELKDSERQKCEVWTRVMGYHRPVQSFNIGKKGEFEERVCFTEKALRDTAKFTVPAAAADFL